MLLIFWSYDKIVKALRLLSSRSFLGFPYKRSARWAWFKRLLCSLISNSGATDLITQLSMVHTSKVHVSTHIKNKADSVADFILHLVRLPRLLSGPSPIAGRWSKIAGRDCTRYSARRSTRRCAWGDRSCCSDFHRHNTWVSSKIDTTASVDLWKRWEWRPACWWFDWTAPMSWNRTR